MKKVYVLIVSDKDELNFNLITPRVFSDKKRCFEIARQTVKDFEECLPYDNWIKDIEDKELEDTFYYSTYEEGYYDLNHFDVQIIPRNIE